MRSGWLEREGISRTGGTRLSALGLAACAEPASEGDAERPNLILIVSDDQGYTDFGFMGSPYVQTPHLDRLAREGTVFPNGFVTAAGGAPSGFRTRLQLRCLAFAS